MESEKRDYVEKFSREDWHGEKVYEFKEGGGEDNQQKEAWFGGDF